MNIGAAELSVLVLCIGVPAAFGVVVFGSFALFAWIMRRDRR